MHQPHQQPHTSGEFKYTVHPFVRPPEMGTNASTRHPVAVIGAGTVELVPAIHLAKHGTPCALIETEAQLSTESQPLDLTSRSRSPVLRAKAFFSPN